MRKLKLATCVAALFTLAVGCHKGNSQVPPGTSYKVNLTWNAPVATAGQIPCGTGTGQAVCTYAVYRCSSNCSVLSSATWQQINKGTEASTLSYTDSTVSTGGDFTYEVTTLQNGAASVPSNTASIVVPGGTPPVSGVSGATQAASLDTPKVILPEGTTQIALNVKAKLIQ